MLFIVMELCRRIILQKFNVNGNGYLMTEVEAHTLGYICDHKETTVTHLAEYSCRTKGTVSKQLKKLEEKGMITRVQKNGNRKWVYFVPTNEGLKANEMHRAYDRIKTMEMLEVLLKNCINGRDRKLL